MHYHSCLILNSPSHGTYACRHSWFDFLLTIRGTSLYWNEHHHLFIFWIWASSWFDIFSCSTKVFQKSRWQKKFLTEFKVYSVSSLIISDDLNLNSQLRSLSLSARLPKATHLRHLLLAHLRWNRGKRLLEPLQHPASILATRALFRTYLCCSMVLVMWPRSTFAARLPRICSPWKMQLHYCLDLLAREKRFRFMISWRQLFLSTWRALLRAMAVIHSWICWQSLFVFRRVNYQFDTITTVSWKQQHCSSLRFTPTLFVATFLLMGLAKVHINGCCITATRANYQNQPNEKRLF